MNYELARDAENDLRGYLYYIAVTNLPAAGREGMRMDAELTKLASSNLNGAIVQIQGWPRPTNRHFIHPFNVYYERRPTGLYVLRLHHHARQPIELL